MTKRQSLYAQIVKLHLEGKVKDTFKVHYTNCSNDKLEKIISESTSKVECKCSDNKLKMLINILKERHLLLQSDVDKIMNA